MKNTAKSQKIFFSYLAIVLALFVLALIVYPTYQNIILNNEKKSSLQADVQRQSSRLDELQAIRTLLQNQEDATRQKIESLSQEFQEYDILEYIHNYSRSLPWRSQIIVIRDMSISPAEVTDIGFSKTTVNLSFVVSNEQTLFNFFEYLTDDSNKFRFYIPSFSYQLWDIQGSFAVQVPLVLYHR